MIGFVSLKITLIHNGHVIGMFSKVPQTQKRSLESSPQIPK